MSNLPKAYGITGGIATGKSTVCQFFKELGVPVVSADEVSREICKSGEFGWKGIREIFGGAVFKADQTLDREKLGRIVFSDPKKRKQLEGITHPLIKEVIRKKLRVLFDKGERLALVEAAVLMESKFDQEFHGSIVVTCRQEQQIERASKRDGFSKEEVLKRIEAQWPLEKKVQKATFVIDNSGTLEETKQLTKAVFEKIRRKKEGDAPLWH